MGKLKAIEVLFAETTMVDFDAYCKETCIDTEEQTMRDYRDWKNLKEEDDWEDMLMWFDRHSLDSRPCMIQGMVGRWNGTFEIIPKYAPTIEDALMLCSRDTDVKSVVRRGNEIEVKCGHHDGTDVFKIVFLSEIGQRKYWDNNRVVGLKNRENVLKLP